MIEQIFSKYSHFINTHCIRSIAEPVTNRPIGNSSQYNIHHVFHHDVHLLEECEMFATFVSVMEKVSQCNS